MVFWFGQIAVQNKQNQVGADGDFRGETISTRRIDLINARRINEFYMR